MRYGLLTGARLRRTDQTLCIRDMAFGPLVLHPQSWSDEMEEVCASPVWQGRFRQATGMPRAPSLTAMWVWLETSANEMGEAGVPEPYWVKDLPHGLKCWLRMGRRLVHTPR